jgi:phosphoenolpyruvate synthase/pyruvate phosphate dikinase
VYFFGGGKADGDRTMKDLLGGKGSGLAEMTNAGLPVPPGFTISTDVCNLYYESGGSCRRDRREMLDNLQEAREGRRRDARLDARTRCSCRSARARSSRCPA